MDELTLCGLQYHAHHGFYEEERKNGNDFEVDIIFYADLRKPGKTDALSATIDYQQAEQIVRGVMEGPAVELIEALVLKIGDALFEHFPIAQKLTVRVRKLHPRLQTPVAYAQIMHSWTRS